MHEVDRWLKPTPFGQILAEESPADSALSAALASENGASTKPKPRVAVAVGGEIDNITISSRIDAELFDET